MSLANNNERYVVSTFYKFVNLTNTHNIQVKLLKTCKEEGILGTILLAEEGINATICGPRSAINNFYHAMSEIYNFSDIYYQESYSDIVPFQKLKIKVKPEIVTLKHKIDMSNTGEYLSPDEWDAMLEKHEAIVIDTRNDYEVLFGTFVGATNPETSVFSELPEWAEKNLVPLDRDTPIAMFCTGGVRCEKSTAYVKSLGFTKVYHLQGGILNYLRTKGENASKWLGQCFIFDERLTLNNKLEAE